MTMTNKTTSGPRSALAAAIKVEQEARKALDDARAAHERASHRIYDAAAALDALRAEPAPSASIGAALVEAHAGGGDIDVLDLERPSKERAAEIERRERELSILRQGRDELAAEIEKREQAHRFAEMRAEKLARDVLAESIDLPALIAETEALQEQVLSRRALLRFLTLHLPDFSEEKGRTAHFIARRWDFAEQAGGLRDHPSLAPWKKYLGALKSDASALPPQ